MSSDMSSRFCSSEQQRTHPLPTHARHTTPAAHVSGPPRFDVSEFGAPLNANVMMSTPSNFVVAKPTPAGAANAQQQFSIPEYDWITSGGNNNTSNANGRNNNAGASLNANNNMSSSLRPDQELVSRTVDEAALHRVAVLERDVRVLRQQLVQITDQLLYSRQKLDLLAQELISRNVVSAVPNGSTNSNAAVDHMMAGGNMIPSSRSGGRDAVPVPAVGFQDHQTPVFGGNMMRSTAMTGSPNQVSRARVHHSEQPAWKRRLDEDRLITKEDVQCFKKATIQRAIYLAQVGHEEMPPINEVFAVKSFAGRSKSKSTLYRIRNMLSLFNTVFQGRFDYTDEFVGLMSKGPDAIAEHGSWCELGDFFSKDKVRDVLQNRTWPACKDQFIMEWNRFRRQRSRQRPSDLKNKAPIAARPT